MSCMFSEASWCLPCSFKSIGTTRKISGRESGQLQNIAEHHDPLLTGHQGHRAQEPD